MNESGKGKGTNSINSSTSSSNNYILYIGIVVGIILIIGLTIFAVTKYKSSRPVNPENQKGNADALLAAKGGGRQGGDRQGLTDDSALINYNVLGCRLAGYLGPGIKKDKDNFGTFNEAVAIDKALLLGARVFIFDIDFLDQKPGSPVLVSRDIQGNLMSVAAETKDEGPFRNVGSILKCTRAIANGIKASKNNNDPVICVLSFLRIPGGNPRSAEGLRFMQEVYKQFKPLIPFILTTNINGTYVHRRKETDLFLSPISYYRNNVIMLTNADTTGFTLEKMPDGINLVDGDLDQIIHARLYSGLENSGLNLYELPKNGVVSAAYANTISYYTTIPQDKIGYESDITRNNWSIALSPEFENSTPDQKTLETLHDKLGVQCIPINMFYIPDDAKDKNTVDLKKIPIYSTKWFNNRSFRLKPAALQYERPIKKVIDKPNPQMDTRGGFVQTPSARNK